MVYKFTTPFRFAVFFMCLLFTTQLIAFDDKTNLYNVVKQYTKDNGLPVNAVTDLAIDEEGFLWIATHDGLLRFDGLSFKLLNTNSHTNMPSNQVRMIKSLESGGLMVLFGVNQLYLFINDEFLPVGEVTLDSFALTKNQLWFGTKQGLFVRDLTSHQTREIKNNLHVTSLTINNLGVYFADKKCQLYFYSFQENTSSSKTKLDCEKVNEMQISNNNQWAIGTNNGVFVLGKKVKQYLPEQQILKLSWINNQLYTLSGSLYMIDTDGTVVGLSQPNESIVYLDSPARLDDNGDVWINGFSTLWVNNDIAYNANSSIFKHVVDKQGGLWVATKGDGLIYLRKPVMKTLGLDKNQLQSGFVTSVDKTSDGNYLAIDTTGLYRFNPQKPNWHKYESFSMARIFLNDSKGNIWVANKGLCRLNRQDQCIKQPYPVSAYSDVQLLFEDSEGKIWVGSEEGLFVQHNNNWQQLEDHNNQYVFATEVPNIGVFLASRQQGISLFKNKQKIDQIDIHDGLPTNKIRTFYFNPDIFTDGILVGTEDKGLCLWQFKGELVRCANEAEGLPHYGIHRILSDRKNRLWISSNKGIYALERNDILDYFNFKSNFLPSHRFGKSDGMADSEANGGVQTSGTIGHEGDLWFPTQKGIVRIPANDLEFTETPLTPYFKEVIVGGIKQSPDQPIIIKDPEHRHLTVSVSTIALGLSDGIRFRYRLKSNHPWNEIERSQEVSFDALPVGQHNLSFQAARYGHWIGPTTQLAIQVKPTLYETFWFRISIIIFIALLLFWWIHTLRKRKDTLEIEVHKRTTQLSKALETISKQNNKIKKEADRKQQHFLDLSHELRTPLTLVMGPLQGESPIKPDTRKMMVNNSKRLLHLINQMLKLEQLDLFDSKTNLTTVSLTTRCQLGADQFKHKMTKQKLRFELDNSDNELFIQGNTEEIDTLIINLISNAVKFTPPGGLIRLSTTSQDAKLCTLTIEDSGPGIPTAKRNQIFNRFVRLNQEDISGSGLGLSIVKRIVTRHHGSITVNKSALGGAQFQVTLPLTKTKQTEQTHNKSSKQTVMVVDDNADILHYIKSILSDKYQVITIQSAKECLNTIPRTRPDILIVDIGMPDMNGFELVAAVRQNIESKNIPVIFATARAHPNDHVKAIETGGDAFMTKPFTAEQLLAYVKRFLTTKTNLEHSKSSKDQPKSLLNRSETIILDALSDANFGVEELASELAMSRSALYRKFKQEVNFSPAEYISRCRMERAGQLLQDTTLSVAKVSQMTGFKQVSTFTRSFHRFYGHNPTEHRNQ